MSSCFQNVPWLSPNAPFVTLDNALKARSPQSKGCVGCLPLVSPYFWEHLGPQLVPYSFTTTCMTQHNPKMSTIIVKVSSLCDISCFLGYARLARYIIILGDIFHDFFNL